MWSSLFNTTPLENLVDDDNTKDVLEPDNTSGCGLHLSEKEDRVAHGQLERKSILESQITEERVGGISSTHGSRSSSHSEDIIPSSKSSRSIHHWSSRHYSTEHDAHRSDYKYESKRANMEPRKYNTRMDNQVDESRSRSIESPRYRREHIDYGNKRRKYESSRRMSGHDASPWDSVGPSPVPISAAGSIRYSPSRSSGRSQQTPFVQNSLLFEDKKAEKEKVFNSEIPESMRLEMEYNSDRAWYDREEGNTMFDADISSLYLGDAFVQKKEAELEKRRVQRDGTRMTLAQTKKLSQRAAADVQWENRQLVSSGAVSSREVQTEFDDEEERRKQSPHFWMEELCSLHKQTP